MAMLRLGSAHGFEGKSILEFVGDLDQRPALSEARRKLFQAREERVHPGRDESPYLMEWVDAGRFCRGG